MTTEHTPAMLLHIDPDYINLRRFEFSISKLEQRYPDGAPDHVIADALGIEESEVEAIYQQIVAKLRATMGID